MAALTAVLPRHPHWRRLSPADGCVLLNAEGWLELAATDRGVAIRYLVSAHVTGPGEAPRLTLIPWV